MLYQVSYQANWELVTLVPCVRPFAKCSLTKDTAFDYDASLLVLSLIWRGLAGYGSETPYGVFVKTSAHERAGWSGL